MQRLPPDAPLYPPTYSRVTAACGCTAQRPYCMAGMRVRREFGKWMELGEEAMAMQWYEIHLAHVGVSN